MKQLTTIKNPSLCFSTPPLQADFDKDDIIGLRDFDIMAADWLKQGSDLATDVYPDQKIDFRDFSILLMNWGQTVDY